MAKLEAQTVVEMMQWVDRIHQTLEEYPALKPIILELLNAPPRRAGAARMTSPDSDGIGAGEPTTTKRRKRRKMSAAAREAASKRMKAQWRARRKMGKGSLG